MFEGMIRTVFRSVHAASTCRRFPVMTLRRRDAPLRLRQARPARQAGVHRTHRRDARRRLQGVLAAPPHAKGGRVAALRVPGGGEMSRGEIDAYTEFVKIYGAKGLAWIKVNDVAKGREGLQSPIVKNLQRRARWPRSSRAPARATATCCSSAPTRPRWSTTRIGALRVKIGHSEFGRTHGLFEDKWAPLWVVDFPMFEYDEEAPALGRGAPSVHRAEGRPRGPDGHRPRASASPRPTTWCSTAGRSAAARCVSTARKCRARCSAR